MASIKQFRDPLTIRKKSRSEPTVQRKLKVGNPNGKSEKEADKVADKVMLMPENEEQESVNMQPQQEEEKVSKISRQAETEEEDSSKINMQPEEEEKNAVSMKPEDEEKSSIQKQEDEELQKQGDDEEKLNLQSEEEEANLKSITASAKTNYAPSNVADQINVSKSGGQPLPEKTNKDLSRKIGRDFSDVKVHTDSKAVEMNKDLNAKAFTHKNHIYFNQGQFAPKSHKGKGLLAHELTHVVQQSGHNQQNIQLARLRDFIDTTIPANDPGRLSNAQIEATNEYKSLMNAKLSWQTKNKVTKAEAQLTCRLILRHIREKKPYNWLKNTGAFIIKAREQLGTMSAADAFKGTMVWTPFNSGKAASNPSALKSEFGKWLLAGGAKPASSISVMNCWEMVMYSANSAGYISESRMKQIYNLAVANVKKGSATSVGDTVETELKASSEYIFDSTNADTPKPLSGDMIIFKRAAVHAAISLGTVNSAGEHEIISLWNYNRSKPNVEKTTIETLLRAGASKPVKFWSVKW